MKQLRVAFPRMETNFFDLLTSRIINNDFSEKRLKDAVNYVLDNFQYKELNISDIIKFDRRVKLHTYHEVCTLITQGRASFEDFEIRKIEDDIFRVRKADLI